MSAIIEDVPEPLTPEACALGCSCRMSFVWSNSIDPPEPIVDKWCPVHGRDPDADLQAQRDGELN